MSFLSTAVRTVSALIDLTRPTITSSSVDGDEMIPDIWGGEDDLWPEEDYTEEDSPTQLPGDSQNISGGGASFTQPELLVTKQFGIRLPDGRIVWNRWQNIPFDTPLDRIRMVATLQKTAENVGFPAEEFTGRYSWASRQQIASVVYGDIETYTLTAHEVCSGSNDIDTTAPQATPRPHGDGGQGSVGGEQK